MPYKPPGLNGRDIARALGVASMAQWAKGRGFGPSAVAMTLRRWGHRPERRPHGGISRQIMAALREDLARAAERGEAR